MEPVLETFYKVVDEAANAAVVANSQKIWGMVPGIRREMDRLAFSTDDTEEARRLVRRYTREQTKLLTSEEGFLIRGFNCHKCDKHFMKAFQFSKHLRNTHGLRVKTGFQCLTCDFTHETVQPIVNHLMKSHVKQDEQNNYFYECPKTGMKFLKGINEDMLRTFLVYTGNYCNFEETEVASVDRLAQVSKLLLQVKQSTQGDYYCTHCQDTFNSTHSLAKHFMKDAKISIPNLYYCPKCLEVFKQSTSLAIHLVESHGKNGSYKCSDTGQRFKNIEQFSTYVKQSYSYSTFFTKDPLPASFQKKYET